MRVSTQPGSLIGGKYVIKRLLGQGGMGSVYEAEHHLTRKRVAIKCLRSELSMEPDATKRLVREAQATARIRHPNVVDVFDVGQDDETVFLVMELLEGEPLSSLLRRGTTPLPEVIGLLLSAMRGVAAAHENGLVHRDIKPENIFLALVADTPQPLVKVLDFGISKLTDTDSTLMTRTGIPIGTPMYMPYEQLCGEKDIDERADVYAFGVILYEIVVGMPPYYADSFAALAVKIATTEPLQPRRLRPEIPEALEALVMRALSKQRAQRPATMREFIRELTPFSQAGALTLSPRASSPAPKTPSTLDPRSVETANADEEFKIKRSLLPRLVVLTSAAGLLAAVGGMFWFSEPSPGAGLEESVSAARSERSLETAAREASSAPAEAPVAAAADEHSKTPPNEAQDAKLARKKTPQPSAAETVAPKPAQASVAPAHAPQPTAAVLSKPVVPPPTAAVPILAAKPAAPPATPLQLPLQPPGASQAADDAPKSAPELPPPSAASELLPPSPAPMSAAEKPAAEKPAAPDEATRARARQIGDVGMQAYLAGNFSLASSNLDKAFRMFPLPTLGLWSARSKRKLGKLIESADRYRETMSAAANGGTLDTQQEAQRTAERELAELSPHIPSFTVSVEGAPASEAKIMLDGAALPTSALNTQRPTNPGNHTLIGMRGSERLVVQRALSEDEHTPVVFRFQGETPPAAAAPRSE